MLDYRCSHTSVPKPEHLCNGPSSPENLDYRKNLHSLDWI